MHTRIGVRKFKVNTVSKDRVYFLEINERWYCTSYNIAGVDSEDSDQLIRVFAVSLKTRWFMYPQSTWRSLIRYAGRSESSLGAPTIL